MDPVTAGAFSYPDSVNSSPRSRGGESWDEPHSSATGTKLRLMCSYGGRIVPRPTDKSLSYLGGETRIVVVDRNSSLSDLHSKLSCSLSNTSPFTLKYQLPNEDLDSLISLTTDEDLDNMVDEYDRIQQSSHHSTNPAAAGSGVGSNKSPRIRLFLFPNKLESAPSSIGSLLDDSKSEIWFVDALNGAMGMGVDGLPTRGSTDSASVNFLGLEDDSSVLSRAGVGSNNPVGRGGGDADRMDLPRPDSSGKLGTQVQDVSSVPDSPMLETTSSFGSASSTLSNLPPIRVRPDDRLPDSRYGNLDEHFQQMNLHPYSAMQSPPTNPPPVIAQPNPEPDPTATYRVQQISTPVPESNYIKPTISAPEQRHPQFQQQQQQPQYVHLPPYYQQVPHPIQQSQRFDPSTPLYYFPVHQNPPKHEPQPTMYRSSAALQAQMIHPGMGYQLMHHHHPSQAQIMNYGYEYSGNADMVHQAQGYYAQTTSAPSMPVQYQTAVTEEVKQNRPS